MLAESVDLSQKRGFSHIKRTLRSELKEDREDWVLTEKKRERDMDTPRQCHNPQSLLLFCLGCEPLEESFVSS